jgi:N-acetylglucosaminyldiphosphoundecaprenol N-acetyl-beta-D-mannosaminyltransferase
MPGLKIAGRRNGYVEEGREEDVVALINQCRPDMLFVALGSPRQEQWMSRWLPQLDVRICQGVGGTFDVLSGVARRAPRAVQRLRLEWLFRLLADPRRAKRQAALPRFAAAVLRERLKTLR